MKFNLSKLLLAFVVLFMIVLIGLAYYDSYRSVTASARETAVEDTETAAEIETAYPVE